MASAIGGSTLQTTALVHEAWIRLMGEGRTSWSSRALFFSAASTAMRRILVEEARSRSRLRHGGALSRVAYEPEQVAYEEPTELLDLDVAIEKLRRLDPRLAKVVDLRVFGGLTTAEAALVSDCSERTVRREWRAARLWLYRSMREAREECRNDACHGS